MQISKRYIYILCGVGLLLIGISIGLFLGNSKENAKNQAIPIESPAAMQMSSPATPEADEPSPTPYAGVYYFLQVEGENLCLYEIDGAQKTLIKKAEIQTAMFPASDNAMLKQGIRLANLEESIPYFEDFTS